MLNIVFRISVSGLYAKINSMGELMNEHKNSLYGNRPNIARFRASYSTRLFTGKEAFILNG